MTHRERVLASANHEATDRPPMDLIAEETTQAALMRHFGVSSMDEVRLRFDTDIRNISHMEFAPTRVKDETGAFTDFWGVRRRPVFNQFGSYDEVEHQPFAQFTGANDVETYPWPAVDVFDFSTLEERCEAYRDEYAVVFGAPGIMDLINGISFGRGMEQLLIDIALDDPAGMGIIETRYSFYLEVAERGLKAANGLIDILWIGDDYGTQMGQLFSFETWSRVFRPKLQSFIDLAHRYGAKVMLHSCGSNRGLIPTWIDMGLDIYQAVQVEAAGMDAVGLFRDFGKHITFHGMMGLQGTLPHGTPEDIRDEIGRLIEASGGTGWILAASHNIQPDVPMENIMAMYEAIPALTSPHYS